MALDGNFYKLTFNNKSEYIIQSEKEETKKILGILTEGLLNSEYIALQYAEGQPVFIRKEQLFSVQKASNSTLNSQTRVWRLV